MKKLYCILFAIFCLSACYGQTTATFSGHLSDPSTTAVTSRTFARFELKNTGGNQCKISGSTLLTPYQKDFAPNASGAISGSLYRNDAITCGSTTGGTMYGFTIWRDGNPQPTCYISVTASSINLDSTTCNNTNPVVPAPTGDSTYARLDNGNTGSWNPKAQTFTETVGAFTAIWQATTLTGNRVVNTPDAASTTAQATTPASHQYLTSMSAQGLFTQAQPAAADLSDGVSGTGSVCMTTNCVMTTPNIGAATATNVTTPLITQTAATIFAIKDNSGGTRFSVPSNGTSQATLNNTNCTGSCTLTQPTVATGVTSGSGFKHQRFGATNNTAASAGAGSTTTYTWSVAFADTSYSVVCDPDGAITGNPAWAGVVSKTASQITVEVIATVASASGFAGVDCMAAHD